MNSKTLKSTRQRKRRNTRIVMACVLVTCVFICQAPARNRKSSLQVHLVREVTIDSNTPNLGHVSIVRGEDSLVAKAIAVTLGRFSLPGQKLIVDRALVLSRLACNGIPASKVTLTGAEEIVVKQQEQSIKSSEFVETGLLFLKKNPPHKSVCECSPMRKPKDLVIPALGKDAKLVPHLAAGGLTKSQVKVQIAAISGGKKIGTREVTYRLKYTCRRMVTKAAILQGAVVSPANVKIEKFVSNYPEPVNWTAAYGLVARRPLPADTVVHPNMVGPVKPQVLLKRNQNVVIKIDRFGLLVTAMGRAMQEGRVGEFIKVQNIYSQRIILAKVNEDGTVNPIF